MSQKIRVIICDDHSLFREGVKSSLSYKEDISIVAEACDGMDLLNKLNQIETDVILLDINMPRMDGLAVLPILKTNDKYKDIKVIILSMHNQMSMVSKMMGMGANSYLTKESDRDLIYNAIVTCYERDYFFNDLTNKSLLNMVKKNPTIFLEDEEFADVENKRQLKKHTQPIDPQPIIQNNKKSNPIVNTIVKGLAMGLISCIIIIIGWLILKVLNNDTLDFLKNISTP